MVVLDLVQTTDCSNSSTVGNVEEAFETDDNIDGTVQLVLGSKVLTVKFSKF